MAGSGIGTAKRLGKLSVNQTKCLVIALNLQRSVSSQKFGLEVVYATERRRLLSWNFSLSLPKLRG